MRAATTLAVTAMLLLGGCGSSAEDGEDASESYLTVKATADDLTSEILDGVASSLDGATSRARGEFVECGVGPNRQRYSVRGELRSQVEDDAAAAQEVEAVLAGSGLDVTVAGDDSVSGTGKGAEVVVQASIGRPVGGQWIRVLRIQTGCETYSATEAHEIGEIPAQTYEESGPGA